MSAALVRDFFPSIDRFVRSQPLIHQARLKLMPESIERLCPRPQISLQVSEENSLTLMWPYASIFCVLGIILGLSHATLLLRNSFTNGARRGSFTWGFAFLWYGTMSLGGLFYHCLTPQKVFYLMDVVSTACSSISIVAGYFVFTSRDDRDRGWRQSLALFYLLVGILVLQGPQILKELLYVLPAVSALVFGIWFVRRASKGRSWRALAWLCCAIWSATIAVVGIPLDAWLCRNLGANWSTVVWFFMGCDGAICCLYQFVRIAATDEEGTTHHQERIKHKTS